MRVSRSSLVGIIALLLGLALAVPSFAKGNSTTFTLATATKVAGNTLAPGDYQVAISDTTATFKQHGKLVAEVKGEWKKTANKDGQDWIVRSSNGDILEIHLQGHDSYFAVS